MSCLRTIAATEAGHPEWLDLPASPSEARALQDAGWPVGLSPHFFSGKPCKRGHVSPRPISTGICVECSRAASHAFEAHRHASQLKATSRRMTAADHEAMRALYDESARLTRETGIPHHVDHIVPLRATCPRTKKRNACGLHVPANLQVIPASENMSKRHWFNGGWP